MKTILVLTDFSDNARNAANIALDVAIKLDANLLLLNSYLTPTPIIPAYEAGIWPEENINTLQKEFKDDLASEKIRLLSILNNKSNQLSVKSILTEGDLAQNIKQVVKNKDIDLIVMGGRNKPDLDFLFGSDINAVIQKADCPVLIIPNNINSLKLNKITFSTDLGTADLKSIEKLAQLLKTLNAHINVVHVSKPVLIADFKKEDHTPAFMAGLDLLNLKNVSYHNLRGENIIAELEQFNDDTDAGLMAMVYKKHSLLWNIFFNSHCKTMIDSQKLPLLIFPEV
jgi:nucleotide-binding universal stress UspA family protein